MIERLTVFYAQRGISAVDFNCPSQGRCRAAVEAWSGTFTEGREIVIGERFLDSRRKIVVISLDPGSQLDKSTGSIASAETRRLYVRNKDASNDELGPSNRHWYRTHEGVRIIINNAVNRKPITVNEAARWFAHTSVARCCANFPHSAQAPWELYWNCRCYLEEEIKILGPDIIWTQGDEAYSAMSWLACHIEPTDAVIARQAVRRVRLPFQNVIWVHTSHPSARGASKWDAAIETLHSVSWILVNPRPKIPNEIPL